MEQDQSRFAGDLFGLSDLRGGFDLMELARFRADKMFEESQLGRGLVRDFYKPQAKDPRLLTQPGGWDGTQPMEAFGV